MSWTCICLYMYVFSYHYTRTHGLDCYHVTCHGHEHVISLACMCKFYHYTWTWFLYRFLYRPKRWFINMSCTCNCAYMCLTVIIYVQCNNHTLVYTCVCIFPKDGSTKNMCCVTHESCICLYMKPIITACTHLYKYGRVSVKMCVFLYKIDMDACLLYVKRHGLSSYHVVL